MIISVASGKGGTGKTTVATSLALCVPDPVQFLDCDVEAPNAHILLKPEMGLEEVVGLSTPRVDESQCDFCGVCAEVCAYGAICVLGRTVMVLDHLCHGCGGCALLCPRKAISEVQRPVGMLEVGTTHGFGFVHGRLDVGQIASPHLIRAVKQRADPDKIVILDAPPGTSCPAIEAVKHTDYCLLVTEPTPFGLHDLILAVEALRKLGVLFGVLVNRSGLGGGDVEAYCLKERIPVVGRIPHDRRIAEAYSRGEPIVEALPAYREEFARLYRAIQEQTP